MRPGRMKHKAHARRRRVAVTCAGVSALTVMGGTSAFATDGGPWEEARQPDATLDNGGDAKVHVEPGRSTSTPSSSREANTGCEQGTRHHREPQPR